MPHFMKSVIKTKLVLLSISRSTSSIQLNWTLLSVTISLPLPQVRTTRHPFIRQAGGDAPEGYKMFVTCVPASESSNADRHERGAVHDT